MKKGFFGERRTWTVYHQLNDRIRSMTRVTGRPVVLSFLNVDGMAFYPFILLKSCASKKDELLIRHETIHLRQQAEMLVLPFYFCYLANYLINRLRYDHHNAYLNIIFEQEAYAEEGNPVYLKQRKLWAWLKYLKHSSI